MNATVVQSFGGKASSALLRQNTQAARMPFVDRYFLSNPARAVINGLQVFARSLPDPERQGPRRMHWLDLISLRNI
jgi:hypothetical protein